MILVSIDTKKVNRIDLICAVETVENKYDDIYFANFSGLFKRDHSMLIQSAAFAGRRCENVKDIVDLADTVLSCSYTSNHWRKVLPWKS